MTAPKPFETNHDLLAALTYASGEYDRCRCPAPRCAHHETFVAAWDAVLARMEAKP